MLTDRALTIYLSFIGASLVLSSLLIFNSIKVNSELNDQYIVAINAIWDRIRMNEEYMENMDRRIECVK